jgi:hypothetical protein
MKFNLPSLPVVGRVKIKGGSNRAAGHRLQRREEMKVKERRTSENAIEIPLLLWFRCENCGKERKILTNADVYDLFCLLSGRKFNAKEDCKDCGDTMLAVRFFNTKKSSDMLYENVYEIPGLFWDLTHYQDSDEADEKESQCSQH